MTNKRRVTLSVDLWADQLILLERLADASGRTTSEAARWLLAAAMADPACWPAGTDTTALA